VNKLWRLVSVSPLVLLLGLAVTAGLGLAPSPVARAAGPTCTVGSGSSVDYKSIAAAIADAGCTTIELEAGVYNEHLTIDRAVTIRGPRLGSAVIDGGGTDRVLTVTVNGDAYISRVSIYNGNHSLGGGIRNEGTLTLSHVSVRDNVSPASSGGGIYNQGTLVIENDSTIYNNTSQHGGGIYNSGGEVTISDSTVISNAATNQSGGGIYNFNGPLAISDSDILSNTAATGGAGVCSENGTLTVTGSVVMSNTAGSLDTHRGGGIHNYNGSLFIRDSTIAANTAGCGGGVYASAPSNNTLVIEDTTITGNQAVYTGTFGSLGGGLYNGSNVLATLTDVTISDNTANKNGGGIHATSSMTLTNVTVSGNTAEYGGGINSTGSAVLTIRFSTIASNTTGGGAGSGGIFTYATVNLEDTILAYNEAPNCASDGSGTVNSNGHNLDSGNSCNFAAAGDLPNTDPLLDPLTEENGAWVHPIPEDSPAVDAGACLTGVTTDQRGIGRPQGDDCDIGAYEWGTPKVYLPLVLND